MIIYRYLLSYAATNKTHFLWQRDKDKRLTEGFNISSDVLIIHNDPMQADEPPN